MVRFASVALSRCESCSLREAASGCAPDRAVTFFCFAKRKSPKKRRPCSPVGLGPTALRCSVFAGRAELTALASLSAFRQASRSQLLKRAARALQSPALLDDSPRGPRAMRELLRNFPVHASLRIGEGEAEPIKPMRSEPSLVFIFPLTDELSSTGLCGARASAHQRLTSRRLSERSEHSERSEFGAAAMTEQRKAALASRGPRRRGRFFAHFLVDTSSRSGDLLTLRSKLCRYQRRSAAGPNTRRGLTQ